MQPFSSSIELETYNQLVLQYQEMVYNQACRLLGEPQAAEDATQEAFIRAYYKFDSYRGGSLKAWLLRIVVNLCYDYLRRLERQPQVALLPLNADGEEIESPHWLVDPSESPEAQAERSEFQQKLQGWLDALPLEQRTVVSLVDLQGLNYQEAAAVMETSVGTIKSRLSRARCRLRKALLIEDEFQPFAYFDMDFEYPERAVELSG